MSNHELSAFDAGTHNQILWDVATDGFPQVPDKTFHARAPAWVDSRIRDVSPSKGGTRAAIDLIADAIAFRLVWAVQTVPVFVCLPDDYHPIISIALDSALADCGLAVMFWQGQTLIPSELVRGSTKKLMEKFSIPTRPEFIKTILALPVGGTAVLQLDERTKVSARNIREAINRLRTQFGYSYTTFATNNTVKVRRSS